MTLTLTRSYMLAGVTYGPGEVQIDTDTYTGKKLAETLLKAEPSSRMIDGRPIPTTTELINLLVQTGHPAAAQAVALAERAQTQGRVANILVTDHWIDVDPSDDDEPSALSARIAELQRAVSLPPPPPNTPPSFPPNDGTVPPDPAGTPTFAGPDRSPKSDLPTKPDPTPEQLALVDERLWDRLRAAGLPDAASVQAASDETIRKIDGIGPKTFDAIRAVIG